MNFYRLNDNIGNEIGIIACSAEEGIIQQAWTSYVEELLNMMVETQIEAGHASEEERDSLYEELAEEIEADIEEFVGCLKKSSNIQAEVLDVEDVDT